MKSIFFSIALLFVLLTPAAAQEKRVALVVGNSAYKFNTTLKNPAHDAADVANALTEAGFEVFLRLDADLDTLNKAVREFGTKLKDPQAVGLFYYSGHGAQVQGKNYLIPVSADIQDADEVAYKALDTEAVLAKMESAGNSLNIVILDACRNNPFPGSGRSGDRGLSALKVSLPESVIVYATEPGRVADDGNDRNSPFTAAFLSAMNVPGQDITMMMKKLTADVRQKTGGRQSPRVDSNLTRDFMFFEPTEEDASGAPAFKPTAVPQAPKPQVSWQLPVPTAKIEGGTFIMGRNNGDANEKPAHKVTLTAFILGKTPVTHAQWEAVMGARFTTLEGAPEEPVTGVTFLEAVAFCNKLSQKEGLPLAYQISGEEIKVIPGARGWRLPTEAQFEFAARGGKTASASLYPGSGVLDEVAWYAGNEGSGMPVATKNPNALGLYDMSGLVSQWCWDWFDTYPSSDQKDPLGPDPWVKVQRVVRGGNSLSEASECTVYSRAPMLVKSPIMTGFRVARPAD